MQYSVKERVKVCENEAPHSLLAAAISLGVKTALK